MDQETLSLIEGVCRDGQEQRNKFSVREEICDLTEDLCQITYLLSHSSVGPGRRVSSEAASKM